MADYQYNQSDKSNLHSAFVTLQSDEKTGFVLGATTFVAGMAIGTFILPHNRFTANLVSLVAGTIIYNTWTHKARSDYSKVAQIANIRASEEINKLMQY